MVQEKKKDKERKGFWKKNKKEAKDAGAMAAGKGERALSVEESRINADAYHRWFQVYPPTDQRNSEVCGGHRAPVLTSGRAKNNGRCWGGRTW